MNNNNNIYNNNFIGSTHIDAYKSTSNLIISTSNTIENHLNASNIANSNYTYNLSINNSNYTYNTSNQITNYFNKLIDNQIEHITFPTSTDLIHTYITNSNLGGEIRFYVKSTSLFPPFIPTDALPYRVRIKPDGKLYVYYTYDPSISLTNYSDWIDVGNTLVSILANNINTGIALTGLQAEVLLLKDKEEADIVGVYSAMVRLHEGDLIYDLDELYEHRDGVLNGLTEVQTNSRLTDAFNNILQAIRTQSLTYLNRAGNSIALMVQENPTISFAIGTGSVVFGIVYSIAQQGSFNNYLNSLYKDIRSNINLTNTEKSNLIAYTSNTLIASNIVQMAVNYSNMSKEQGFINSNILTQQLIPNIITSNINLLNQGSINGVGTAYFNLCQTNNLSTSLNTNVGFPTSNLTGGTGDKLLLRYGSANTYPISIGIDENYSLWNSINSNNTNTAFNWYINSNIKMSLKNNRLDVNTVIYQNGKTLETFTRETILFYTPNVSKKYGFNFSCSTPIIITGNTYYKYDIDLRTYTSTKTAVNINTPYRYFTIRLYLASAYFEIMVNNTYNVLSYEISMSNEANAGTLGGQIGINILAHHIGNTPSNPLLVNILPSYFTLMRTTNFNYLSVISTVQNINLNAIIEDLLY